MQLKVYLRAMMHRRTAFLIGLLTVASAPAWLFSALPTSAPAEVSDRQRLHASDLARAALDFIAQAKYPQAEKSLREALEIVPNKATWVYNLACVLSLRDEPNAAMDCLEQAADLGFTDFTQMEHDPYLITVRALPRYQKLIERQGADSASRRRSGGGGTEEQAGPKYLYETDDEHKLIFAAATDQATLDALKESLLKQAASQWDALFSHKPDEFIRIVVPTPIDFRRLVHNYAASGIYLDESRMLVAPHLGQVVVHEFTHALHAADQRSVGQEHPVWLREGLASMYEAGEFEKDVLQPRDNYRLAFVQSAAKRQALVPLDRLLKYTPQDFVSHSNLAYGESSSLLLYLYEKQQLRPFYDQYKKDYVSDSTGAKTLEKVTGLSLAELQKQWSAWMIDRPVPAQQPPTGGAWIGANFTAAIDGLAVGVVFPNGPAANSGLKTGDVLVGIDDRDVRDTQTLIPLLAAHQPGDLVIVKIRRGDMYVKAPLILGKALRSRLRPEIDHHHIIHHRPQDAAEGFVGGVDQIPVAILVAGEGEHEGVRESLVLLLRADIGPPTQRRDARHLLLQLGKRLLHLLDLLRIGPILKLDQHNVIESLLAGLPSRIRPNGPKGRSQNHRRHDQREPFHIASKVVGNCASNGIRIGRDTPHSYPALACRNFSNCSRCRRTFGSSWMQRFICAIASSYCPR